MNLLKQIIEQNPEHQFLIADGLDNAVIGYCTQEYRLIYSVKQCIEILIAGGMEEIDAIDYLYYKTFTAYVGQGTPIWCADVF
jgi:hypothetical protein